MTAAAHPTVELTRESAPTRTARTPSPLRALWERERTIAARDPSTRWILLSFSLFLTATLVVPAWFTWRETLGAGVSRLVFDAFFCFAFVWVTVGGTLASATSVSGERAAGTWDALVMTGARPRTVALAKLCAAYGRFLGHTVYLVPHAALCLLFEGVPPRELAVAVALLAAISLPCVALGLAFSTLAASPARTRALAVTVAVLVALVGLFGAGYALSFPAHRKWHEVTLGSPVWLPGALDRVAFSREYVLGLVVTPLLTIAVSSAGLFELAVAGLRTRPRQRARGLELWAISAVPLVTASAAVPIWLCRTLSSAERWTHAGLVGATAMMCLGALALAGQPVARGPGDRARGPAALASPLTRAALAQIAVGAVSLGAFGAVARGRVARLAGFHAQPHARAVVSMTVYALVFGIFVVAFVALLGTLSERRARIRGLAGLFIVAALTLPLVASALAEPLVGTADAISIAAPSPLSAKALGDDLILYARPHRAARSGFFAIGFWGVAAIVSLGAAIVRALGRTRDAAHEDAERTA